MQRLAWNIVCPLVKQLKTYHDYSLEVGKLPTTPAPIFVVSETCVSVYLPSLTNHRKHDRRVSQRYSFKSREGELGTFFAHAVSAIFRLSLTHTHNSISVYYPGQKYRYSQNSHEVQVHCSIMWSTSVGHQCGLWSVRASQDRVATITNRDWYRIISQDRAVFVYLRSISAVTIFLARVVLQSHSLGAPWIPRTYSSQKHARVLLKAVSSGLSGGNNGMPARGCTVH